MSQSKNRPLLAVVLLLVAALACNMPRRATPSASELVYTAAAQTQFAQQTLVAQPPVSSPGVPFTQVSGLPTLLPSATLAAPTTSSLPTQTQLPTATTVPCDAVKFEKDVTYPDDSQVTPGQSFTKTWRLLNTGTCTWTTDYDIVFTGGDQMSAPTALPVPGSVPPGQTVDLSVNLVAPAETGTYKGNFMLRNASNVVFGLGDGSKPFWVQVKVAAATGLVYDYLVNASTAEWKSGQGSDPAEALPYNGADDDPKGTAKIHDGVKLENNTTSGKILFTYPRRVDNGYTYGIFPAYLVQSGDRFRGTLGFWVPGGQTDCGSGKVKFQLAYKDDDDIKVIQEWSKSCDGRLLSVDVNLSSLAGKNTQFILIVRADGPATDDWAIWNSIRIQH